MMWVWRCTDSEHASRLRTAPLSYVPRVPPSGEAPPGYRKLSRSVTLTRRDLAAVAADLFAWRMHSRGGVRTRTRYSKRGVRLESRRSRSGRPHNTWICDNASSRQLAGRVTAALPGVAVQAKGRDEVFVELHPDHVA